MGLWKMTLLCCKYKKNTYGILLELTSKETNKKLMQKLCLYSLRKNISLYVQIDKEFSKVKHFLPIHLAIICNSDFPITPYLFYPNPHGGVSAYPHPASISYASLLLHHLKCHIYAVQSQINISSLNFS